MEGDHIEELLLQRQPGGGGRAWFRSWRDQSKCKHKLQAGCEDGNYIAWQTTVWEVQKSGICDPLARGKLPDRAEGRFPIPAPGPGLAPRLGTPASSALH